MQIYRWREIGDVPAEPGVYAWYYAPELTTYDLQRVIATVDQLRTNGDTNSAGDAIRTFLQENLFRYFQEQPYQAILRGPLKPKYEGTLEHTPGLSETLIHRLIEDPRRLETIKQILETSAPNFASPIYIGMAEILRSRLARHKALIERYGEASRTSQRTDSAYQEREERDYSFAREVRRRGIPVARLFVTVQVVPGTGDEYVDVENLLNRIHYPLLGRN